ncbi:MAG: adenosylcobinamide-GDP ribazoletransferase [Candidatus Binatia bacterium]
MTDVEPVHSNDNGEPARRPQLRDLRAALGLLTVLPFDRPAIPDAAAAHATIFFPLVGGLIGLLLTASNWIISDRLPATVSAIVLVGLWEAISGGAALRACGSLSVSRIGSGAGIAAVLLIKIAVLASHVMSRPAMLLFAPMLARWTMVVLAVGARDAAAPSRKLNAAITFREFALTSVFTCAVIFTVAEAFGILLVVGVAALTLGLRLLQHRRPGGTSWPLLLASAELVELLVLGIVGVVGPR